MDTRSKIITYENACQSLRGRPAQWVAGFFDPLLAEHVRELRKCAAPDRILVVEVTNPPKPLLPQKARAELVAALAMVDYVVMGNGQSVAEALGDAQITRGFIEHVLRRHCEERRE